MASIERWKERLARALRAKNWPASLAALEALAEADAREPRWPRRAARIHAALGDRAAQCSALRRALALQLGASRVLEAIATCHEILEADPGDDEALHRLDLLQLHRPAPRAPVSATLAERVLEGSLDELRLAELLPDARLVSLGDDESGAVHEIPIDLEPDRSDDQPTRDAASNAVTSKAPLDLHLDRFGIPGDAADIDAARIVCLPRGEAAAAGGTAAGRFPNGARAELANLPLFGELDPASLHELIRRARIVELEAGRAVFRQGDPANALYVVVEGAVAPIVSEGGVRHELAVLEPGSFFGEIGLLTGEPRNATVTARVETTLIAIDRRVLSGLICEETSVLNGLLRFLRERLLDRLIRTHPLFAAFAHAERDAVARQFRLLEIQPETRIVQQGRAPEGLFVVLAGALDRIGNEHHEQKFVGELGAGDVFGGLALIEGRPAPSSVVACAKCWLVVLGEARLRALLASNPRLAPVLRAVARSGASNPEMRLPDPF